MDYPNSIFHKKFQRINGREENNSFIGNAKIHEYIADSCTTYGRVYNRSSWPRTACSGYENTILQNFMKRLIMAATKIMLTSG